MIRTVFRTMAVVVLVLTGLIVVSYILVAGRVIDLNSNQDGASRYFLIPPQDSPSYHGVYYRLRSRINVSGNVQRILARRLLRRGIPDLHRCFDDSQKGLEKEGELVIQVILHGANDPIITIVGTIEEPDEFTRCISATVKKWDFDSIIQGKTASIEYQIVYQIVYRQRDKLGKTLRNPP